MPPFLFNRSSEHCNCSTAHTDGRNIQHRSRRLLRRDARTQNSCGSSRASGLNRSRQNDSSRSRRCGPSRSNPNDMNSRSEKRCKNHSTHCRCVLRTATAEQQKINQTHDLHPLLYVSRSLSSIIIRRKRKICAPPKNYSVWPILFFSRYIAATTNMTTGTIIPNASPTCKSPPKTSAIAPTAVGPAIQPTSPAKASSAKSAVPPFGILAEAKEKVPAT